MSIGNRDELSGYCHRRTARPMSWDHGRSSRQKTGGSKPDFHIPFSMVFSFCILQTILFWSCFFFFLFVCLFWVIWYHVCWTARSCGWRNDGRKEAGKHLWHIPTYHTYHIHILPTGLVTYFLFLSLLISLYRYYALRISPFPSSSLLRMSFNQWDGKQASHQTAERKDGQEGRIGRKAGRY